MTLSDSSVKIISALCVALLSYFFKCLPKPQLFTIFSRLSTADKVRLFSLLHKTTGGFLDEYVIQSQMLAYGVRYSSQFMKNLFTIRIKIKFAPTTRISPLFCRCRVFLFVKRMAKSDCRKAHD